MHKRNHVVRNCKEFDEKRWHKNGCTSLKLDGVRGFYYPGEQRLVSRQNKPIFGMDHILEALEGYSWPIDMELFIPGLEFNKMSGLIRNHDATPEAQCHIIDIPSPGGLVERLARRPRADDFTVFHLPHFRTSKLEYVRGYYNQWLRAGHEGLVWKSLNHEYLNKRDWNWMRMVPVPTADCKCTGVYEGKGKMAGIAGGIYVDFNGIECKVGTMKGLTYEDRAELLENKESYIGVYAEIHYKNLQVSGKPRQPRFKAWRWDK